MKNLLIALAFLFTAQAFGFGAIAYSPRNGAYGWSMYAGTQWQAENTAMAHCNRPDCRVVVTVNRACAALAVNQYDTRLYGSGWGYYIADARNAAQWDCTGYCSIRSQVCDY